MRVERLDPGHRLDNFDCGDKVLNDWLRSHALENDHRNLSRTFVLVDDGDGAIGFYCLSGGGVMPEELPKKYGRGLPTFSIGTALLGRLAIAETRQGQGLGRDLMVDAIENAARAGDLVAARFIAVDPKSEDARAFYRKFSFKDVPDDPEGRMYLRVDEALRVIHQEQ
jgi:GNAT superfamily N-acetyltransferase